jgi:ATP-dependent DNA helicase RecQ
VIEDAGGRRHAAESVLGEVFGYSEFRAGQAELVDAVLAGRDALGILPTGAGKSLTYQVPARVLGGTTLVVSPLISLMEDQVAALARRGFEACVVNSTLAADERRARLAAVAAGDVELVYAAPEGIEGALAGALERADVRLIAVDEAHCISEWGHDFRPAYRRLADLRRRLPGVPMIALTASATPAVAADIAQQLAMRHPYLHRGSFFRPNLRLACVEKADGEESGAVEAVVERHLGESGVVYCLSRRSADLLAARLARRGVTAASYHAGLTAEERSRVQAAFGAGEVGVVVATVAFGMGIDKADVRFVVHRDLAAGVEAYYQEVGRAGRDGLPAECVMMYSWSDVRVRDGLSRGASPSTRRAAALRARLLYRFARSLRCRHAAVSAYFGERLARCGGSCDRCRPRPRRARG